MHFLRSLTAKSAMPAKEEKSLTAKAAVDAKQNMLTNPETETRRQRQAWNGHKSV